MLSKIILLALTATLPVSANYGYVLPSTGTASTTQFLVGPELASGTACGMSALPNGKRTSGRQGGGPGYLYAAINQLGFGANPFASGGGGPGAACGVCYWITPVSDAGVALHENALKFKIIDECPAKGSGNCGTCSTSQKNVFGHTWHFDIAVDAMSTAQYNQFFKGVTYGSDWKTTYFEKTDCGPENPNPELKSWGCISGCHDNNVGVCEGFTPEFGSVSSSSGGSSGGSPPPSGSTVARYGQCGGENYHGSTRCAAPYTCQKQNVYYSQCL